MAAFWSDKENGIYIRGKIVTPQDLINKKILAGEYAEREAKLWQEIYANCKCWPEYGEVVERYFKGSYLDRASTTYYSKCTICCKSKEIKTVTHNWYG